RTMVGWLGKVEFASVSDLVSFSGLLGPEGTELWAQGQRFTVLGAVGDATLITAGGVRLKLLLDSSGIGLDFLGIENTDQIFKEALPKGIPVIPIGGDYPDG